MYCDATATPVPANVVITPAPIQINGNNCPTVAAISSDKWAKNQKSTNHTTPWVAFWRRIGQVSLARLSVRRRGEDIGGQSVRRETIPPAQRHHPFPAQDGTAAMTTPNVPAAPPACCHEPRRHPVLDPPGHPSTQHEGALQRSCAPNPTLPARSPGRPGDTAALPLRRSRYAVVSALGRANLPPLAREHLRRALVVVQDVVSRWAASARSNGSPSSRASCPPVSLNEANGHRGPSDKARDQREFGGKQAFGSTHPLEEHPESGLLYTRFFSVRSFRLSSASVTCPNCSSWD